MPRSAVICAGVLLAATSVSMAASISKTYSYFTIGGVTIDEIETELSSRGPQLKTTGRRHPGATRMEFSTKLTYGEAGGYCLVTEARVSVKANLILPRWGQRRSAERDVRIIWDTLSSDIKRHEESHVIIAKNHARELEDILKSMPRERSCETLAEKVTAQTAALLERHDAAQERFDRIEGIGFERRMMRLLQYRLEQIEAGRIPG
jgi:predicted secreted Zn-dependent protease